MPANATAITQAGVPYPTAIAPMQAAELARQINAGVYSAHKLALAMWNPALATIIKQQSA